MELIKEFVKATQDLAEAFTRIADLYEKEVGGVKPEKMVQAQAQAKPEEKTKALISALQYPAEENRDAWVLLAERKGIEIPKRTKTPTIIRWVMAHDEAERAAQVPASTAPASTAAQAPAAQAPAAPAPAAQEVPVSPAAQAPAAPVPPAVPAAQAANGITANAVKLALQQYMARAGGDPSAVSALILRVAGVTKVRDIPEEKFAAVLSAAREG